MKFKYFGFLLFLLFGFSQTIDLRTIYSKEFFENWYLSSNLTVLENDTLETLQQIIDVVQKNYVEDKAAYHSEIIFLNESDSLDNKLTIKEKKELAKQKAEEADNTKFINDTSTNKYLFYDSELRFIMIDSIQSNYCANDFKKIYFNPVIEQFKGKVIYIDSLGQQKFKKLAKDLMRDNDDAVGYFHDEIFGRNWYAYTIQYAPFNRHIQSLVHKECLDYSSPSDVYLRPANTIRSIALTKDLKEAAIEIEPTWSTYFYIKKNGKWVINSKRPPLINYSE